MRTSRFGAVLVVGATLALTLGGLTATVAPRASAAGCTPGSTSRGDLDGDGSWDTVVGMPWVLDGHGAVDVRYVNRPDQILHTGDLGGVEDDSDSTGQSLAVDDLDGDGCADLIVGVPGESNAAQTSHPGQVHIVFGAPGGLDLSSAIELPHPASASVDQFGTALALTGQGATHDLYVGAPYATVNGKTRAGEVFHYRITAGGTGRVTVVQRSLLSQNSPGVPGTAEQTDLFGSRLAAGAGDGVLVGDPDEDVGSKEDAGAVWLLRDDTAGNGTGSKSWSQDSSGVPGVAETADGFGTSVGARYGWAVIGVPGEDDGSAKDAGMVQVMKQTSSGGLTPAGSYTQDSSGIPGVVEAGDGFGTAVAVGAFSCQEAVDVAAGAPGEDIGSRADAGTVTLIPVHQEGGCAASEIHQGHGLAGAAEEGDQVGQVLSLVTGDPDADEDYVDTLMLGVPWEDIGTRSNAGLVQPNRGTLTANGVTAPTLQYPTGYFNSEYYGLVLASPSAT